MTENENNPVVTDSKYEEFYCCYLLRSLAPNYKQTGYIGSTNDPKRRLRQHNGEIALGAKKTIKRRPWEMILFVYGFPNHVAALQFEWSWQHPSRTRRLHLTTDDDFRENDEKLSSSLCALSKMLQDKFWSRWPLHLHVITPLETITLNNNNNTHTHHTYALQQQQQQQRGGKKTVRASVLLDVSNLPKKIRVTKGNIEEFNDYHKGTIRKYVRNEYSKYIDQIRNKNNFINSNINTNNNNNNYCNLCLENINVNDHKKYLNCLNIECNMLSHLTCLAKNFTKSEALEKSTFQKPYDELEEEILPVSGKCPTCQMILLWGDLIQAMMVREKYVSNDLVINE